MGKGNRIILTVYANNPCAAEPDEQHVASSSSSGKELALLEWLQ